MSERKIVKVKNISQRKVLGMCHFHEPGEVFPMPETIAKSLVEYGVLEIVKKPRKKKEPAPDE